MLSLPFTPNKFRSADFSECVLPYVQIAYCSLQNNASKNTGTNNIKILQNHNAGASVFGGAGHKA